MHPQMTSILVDERIESLRRAARHTPRATWPAAVDERAVHLRLCRVDDDRALEELAALEGRPLPAGRYVVAEQSGRVVAALPLAGGRPFADPFVHTAQLLPLLELRAAQVRGARRTRLAPVLRLLPHRV